MTTEEIKIATNTEIKVTRYAGGNLKSKIPYVNGQKHGIQQWWREDGQKMWQEIWANGKQHGVGSEWNDNGQKWSQEIWRDGKEHGVWTWWREDGTKGQEIYYLADKVYARIEWDKEGAVTAVKFRPPSLTNTATNLANQKNHIGHPSKNE